MPLPFSYAVTLIPQSREKGLSLPSRTTTEILRPPQSPDCVGVNFRGKLRMTDIVMKR
jgi:hypothetical protein